ncbi:hypothetical protein GCM10010435_41610 [Winogradskya consettensis]|uniref:DUF4345 domain-containing protein n=1 Tax=Winogradskya consettensis TaxID=113560 RepID=A0A919SQR6_9ACTN|nr:DUF4345 domain-containing protein [Actinoplanes consettensis]GIM76807.1 hypothetical protein Aco04nite_52270 [Actinoplanes consettensis]
MRFSSANTLRVLLALLGFVPVGTGLLGVIGGLTLDPSGDDSSLYFNSEYRFLNGVWICAGIALWWSIRLPVSRAATTRFLLVAMIVGGVARAVSVAAEGWPGPVFTTALGVELLAIPALTLWHAREYSLPSGGSAS